MYEIRISNDKHKNWVLWFQNIGKICKSDVTDVQVTKNTILDFYKRYFLTNLTNFNQGKLSLYSKLKFGHGVENYCDIIDNGNHRKALSKIRISAHPLRVETGRYAAQRVERNLRICTFCNTGEIEDEEHFLLRCGKYEEQREIMLQRVTEKCVNFVNLTHPEQTFYLLNSEGECIKSVAKFCWECLEIRSNTTIQSTQSSRT